MKGSAKLALVFFACCGMVTQAIGQDVFSSGAIDTVKKKKQQAYAKEVPKGPKPIKHEVSFGYRLHTLGWGLYTDIGNVKAKNAKLSDMFYNVNYLQIEFSEKKHPKQEKTVVDGNATGRSGSYIYGKINNFYALKLGYGIRKMLAGKPDPGTVSIHWSNVLGASLGMVKPYYLNVYSDPNAIKYADGSKASFLNQSYIVGAAGFGKGLSEMKMVPGGHFKSMLHFDFSASRKSVMAIETGIDIQYYSEAIPLMANQEAKPLFCDVFLSFQFGKRW